MMTLVHDLFLVLMLTFAMRLMHVHLTHRRQP